MRMPPSVLAHNAPLYALLLLVGLCWGVSIPFIKLSVSTGYAPAGVIFWQVVILSMALGAVVLRRREPVPLGLRHLGFYALIGVVGTLLPNSASLIVAAHLPTGFLALLMASVPMFALLIALAIRTERFVARRMLGIALGAGALALIALPELRLPAAGMAPFLLLGLVAPCCYGAEGNIVERLAPADVTPVGVIFASSVIAIPLAALLAWATGAWITPMVAWGVAEWSIIGASLTHAVAYTGYVALVGMAGAVFTSQVSYIVTLTAILVGIVIMNETYALGAWLAVALMLAGVTLVRPAKRRAR